MLRIFLRRHFLRVFERAAIGEIGGDPGRAECMIAGIRGLEERLGIRLLTRTTRSVAPTDAGERLLRSIGPRFEEIDAELAALSGFERSRPAPFGLPRLTMLSTRSFGRN